MVYGKYQKNEVDFLQYATFKFRPTLGVFSSVAGSCGTYALATITGLKPSYIQKHLPKSTDCWSDRSIRKFLLKRGYETIPITVCSVTNDKYSVRYPIKNFHVLLVGQYMIRDEGSWQVIYNKKAYHNYDSDSLDALEFVNNPPMTVYVVWHPKWASKNKQEEFLKQLL